MGHLLFLAIVRFNELAIHAMVIVVGFQVHPYLWLWRHCSCAHI